MLATVGLVLATVGVGALTQAGTASAAAPRITTVSTLSVGLSDSACAVLANGTAKCWGSNTLGELGIGTTVDTGTPTTVQHLTNVKSVSTGGLFSCALQRTGAVWCWGANTSGELGRAGADSTTPVALTGLTGTAAVATAFDTACALNANGTVKCWGSNEFGQLGIGLPAGGFRATPTLVSGLSGVVGITAGFRHFCALRGNGAVVCWGANGSRQVSPSAASTLTKPTPVAGVTTAVAIDAGSMTSCALLSSGAVVCWGTDLLNTVTIASVSPLATPPPVPGISGATQISVGDGHACALLANATATCWGDDGYGELGAGSASGTPRRVSVAGLTGITAISAGSYVTCATLTTGAVKCWGANWHGQLGKGSLDVSTRATKVVGITNATAIGAGTEHACATLSTKRVKCWGTNYNGTLGTGTTWYNSPTPQQVVGITNADAVIAAGGGSTCVRRGNGASASCWGNNSSGQLGDGTVINRSTPVNVVKRSPGDSFASLAVGDFSSCAVVKSGVAWCWGANDWGQLGDGTNTSSKTPVTVALLGAASSVSVGNRTACARRAFDGYVVCWGSNSQGALGRNLLPTIVNQSATPSLITAGGSVASVAVGGSSGCATTALGTVECWGANDTAQLGLGNVLDTRPAPLYVPAFTGLTDTTSATMVAPGGDHSCAVTRHGTVMCWGSNQQGAVGIANTSGVQKVPVNVQGITAVSPTTTAVSVVVGYDFSCALMADHTIDCWGSNMNGQLGNGSGASWTPTSTLASGAAAPATGVTVPWAPAAPAAVPHSHSVSLAWVAPANGGSGITDYGVQVSADNGAHWTTFADGVHALPGATVTGLANGHAYLFRVAAHNAKGTGAFGAARAAIPRTVPSAPSGLKVVGGSKQFTLTWTAPANGGAPITDYVVQYSLNNGAVWSTLHQGVHATNSAVVTNVFTGVNYVFRVAAKNAAGVGAYSSKSAAVKAH
jgi:alpha-tubulin suppressor-like RCC1 family protein